MKGHSCPICGNVHGKISGRVVAVLVGIDQSTVSRFLAGEVNAGALVTDAVAKWLAERPAPHA